MKYIISENKINKFVSIYLNGEKWYVEDIGDGEFDIFNNDDSINSKLKFRIQYSSTVPNKEFNILYIDDDLLIRIINLFGLSSEDAAKSVIDWFNKKYNKTITEKDWEWYMKDNEQE